MTTRILVGDCGDVLRTLPDESVHCVVTSPPYWGLRDYGVPPSLWDDDQNCEHEWGDEIAVNATNHTTKARWNHTRNGRDELQPPEKRVSWLRTEVKQGQFCQRCGAWAGAHGLEPAFELYVQHAVDVFREVRRVMRSDATLWLNLGDSYATGAGKVGERPGGGAQGDAWAGRGTREGAAGKHEYAGLGPMTQPNRMPQAGLKAKDLCGIPWRVALALQADGWWLRQDIIWSKPNPMPESVTDRCTKAHEYIFMLTKSERYHFDADAIAEPAECERLRGSGPMVQPGTGRNDTTTTGDYRKRSARDNFKREGSKREQAIPGQSVGTHRLDREESSYDIASRNKRSVWTVPTAPFPEAHFATFPPALIEPCILAGCPEGGTVLDPFGGAGTTGLVAERLKRDCILIELNPDYAAMAKARIAGDCPMFTEVT